MRAENRRLSGLVGRIFAAAEPNPHALAQESAWEVIEASILGEPDEWEAHSQWAINPKRTLAVWIGGGRGALTLDTNGPAAGGQVTPPKEWQDRLWNAIETLKARRLVDRFRTDGGDYSPEGIAAWLDERSRLLAPVDPGMGMELAICAVSIRDRLLGPNGMRSDEPILQEKKA